MNNIIDFKQAVLYLRGNSGCAAASAAVAMEREAAEEKPETMNPNDVNLSSWRTIALTLRKHPEDTELEAALLGMGLEKIEPHAGAAYLPNDHCPIRPGTKPVVRKCIRYGWRFRDIVVLRASVLLEE